MIYAAGIDVGSTQTKAVLVDAARSIAARALIDTGANVKRAGQRALDELLRVASVSREQVKFVVGTGYGRYKIEAGDVGYGLPDPLAIPPGLQPAVSVQGNVALTLEAAGDVPIRFAVAKEDDRPRQHRSWTVSP